MRVDIRELIEAFERHTKMKRASRGSRSSGLKEAAFVPALNGMWVYMPGGRHFVVSHGGQLEREIRFEAKSLLRIQGVLKSIVGDAKLIEVTVEVGSCLFVCGSSRIHIETIEIRA